METKEGLDKGIIENNLIWADYSQQVDVEVKNNNMLNVVEGHGNYSKTPQFIDDGLKITALSTTYKLQSFSTRIITTGLNSEKNQLVNRVIKSGEKWGIVKSNRGNSISIWGDFKGEVDFTILPTYTLKK